MRGERERERERERARESERERERELHLIIFIQSDPSLAQIFFISVTRGVCACIWLDS